MGPFLSLKHLMMVASEFFFFFYFVFFLDTWGNYAVEGNSFEVRAGKAEKLEAKKYKINPL